MRSSTPLPRSGRTRRPRRGRGTRSRSSSTAPRRCPSWSATLREARERVFLAGWFFSAAFELERGPSPLTLDDLLGELGTRVEVYVLAWAGAPLPLFRPGAPRRRQGARAPRAPSGRAGRGRQARASDALPPREARDHRRPARLHRRHRPHRPRRRPLRRCPAIRTAARSAGTTRRRSSRGRWRVTRPRTSASAGTR